MGYGVDPAFVHMPQYHDTFGPEVADMAIEAGFPPDDEQRLFLDGLFAFDRNGASCAFESAIIAPRQNIKTGALKIAALGWLFLTDRKLVMWSAHLFRTAQEAFRDMEELCAASPSLARRVLTVHRSTGHEAIELKNGNRLMFTTRTKGSGRGLTGDVVVMDEALYVTDAQMGALLPTLSARPDPQIVYASSAGVVESDYLRKVRDRGRAATDPRLFYIEWGDPVGPDGCKTGSCDHRVGAKGCRLDDEDLWGQVNTQLGRRINVETVRAERQALSPEEFARERLGWWDEPAAADQDISLEAWMLAEGDAEPSDPVSLAVDVSPNHQWASIVACGGGVLELVDRRRGSSWLPERLTELAERHQVAGFVLDPAGPIGSLLPELEREGVPLQMLDGKDVVRACSAFVSALTESKLSHRGEADFVQAITGASRRAVGDAWKWSRKDSTVDISPLVAATYAFWADTTGAGEAIVPEIYFV